MYMYLLVSDSFHENEHFSEYDYHKDTIIIIVSTLITKLVTSFGNN